jgi:septum formation protein
MDPIIPHIVLASSSPRRKTLLEQLGLPFTIRVSDIEEDLQQALPPEQLAETLAFQKAQAVAASADGDSLVIGADTIVIDEHGILGKPCDAADASRMLWRLSGQTHQVITGVAVLSTSYPARNLVKHETTRVTFASLSEQDIHWYIHTGEPLDKAGAYAIQGKGMVFVKQIEGCYYNVVGLPVFLLLRMREEVAGEFDLEQLLR